MQGRTLAATRTPDHAAPQNRILEPAPMRAQGHGNAATFGVMAFVAATAALMLRSS